MRKRSPQVRAQRLPVILILTVLVLGVLMFLVLKFGILPLNKRSADQEVNARKEGQEENFEGRKNIYDRNFEELAVSFRRSSLYARPLELKDPALSAQQIAAVMGPDEKNLLSALKSERSFVWLGRDISWAKAEEIANLNMHGVYRLDQVHRFYPGGELASHVIGFMQDDQGLAGVESYYDNILRGGNVFDAVLGEAGVNESIAAGKEGAHLVLTLDSRMQSLLENELKTLLEDTGASVASAVIMIPDSGEILSLANIPAYDPNRFWDFGTEERRNPAIVDAIELGGLERLFHTAAAVDLQLLVLTDSPGDGGAGDGGGAAGRDILAPWVWLREGVYASSELLAIASYDALESGQFRDFAYKVGLSGNEVDLPDELSLAGVREREEPVGEKNGAGTGQTIPRKSATEGQTAQNAAAALTAFCRIINGGKPMTPHILSAIWDGKSVRYLPVRLQEGRGTIKPGASQAIMQDFLKKMAAHRSETLILETIIEKRPETTEPPQSADATTAGKKTNNKRFNLVLLGMIASRGPEAAMVITLDDALIDPLAASPARKVAGAILGKARKYVGLKREVPTVAEISAREDKIYLKWQLMEVRSKSQIPLPHDQQQALMPNVIGQSLRVALQILQPYGLKAQVSGAGRVVKQSPAVGASLQGVDQCVLELQELQER